MSRWSAIGFRSVSCTNTGWFLCYNLRWRYTTLAYALTLIFDVWIAGRVSYWDEATEDLWLIIKTDLPSLNLLVVHRFRETSALFPLRFHALYTAIS